MRKQYLRWLCVVWGVGVMACGGGISEEDFPLEYSQAFCEFNARCGAIRDEDACKQRAEVFQKGQREAGIQGYATFAGSMRSGRLRFDEEKAEACVKRIRANSCDTLLVLGRDGDECNAFTGQQKDGEPCFITQECGPTSMCERPSHPVCTEGICKPRPGEGAKLPGDGAEWWCAPGLTPVDGACQRERTEGEACQGAYECAAGLYCDAFGACRRRVAEGGACGTSSQLCLPNLRCMNGTCQRLGGIGEECVIRFAEQPGTHIPICQNDLFCEAASDTGARKCAARAGLGQPCRDLFQCEGGLICDQPYGAPEGTCRQPGRAGDKCTAYSCAAGAYCDVNSEMCIAQGRQGETCDEHAVVSCLTGLTCMAGKCEPGVAGLCGTK
ncbi:hypothetical protein P2318_02190 [Myxococcaceae bacterium GXIMD 01537]